MPIVSQACLAIWQYNYPMSIASRIRSFREARGWSQAELSRRAKVHLSSLSRWERGERSRISLTEFVKLADALGVSLDDLLGRSTAPPAAEVAVRGVLEELSAVEEHTARARQRLEHLAG